MFLRAAFLSSLGVGILLLPPVARAEICLAPGQSFQCSGGECPVEAGVESGQQHDVVLGTQRVRVRAIDSNLSTENSYAELFAVVVEPNADLFLRAHLDVRYAGFLTGFGGVEGHNFGFVGIRAVVRDLISNEIVGFSTITERSNDGVPFGGGPSAFENLFGPPANRDVPFTGDEGVRLEAGRQYGIGVGVEANARGGAISPGESDYFTAGNGVFLNSLDLVTWADPAVAGFEDDDGDGLPNVWETDGVTDCDGNVLLDLPAMGAQFDHKDLFVEIDWLEGQEPHPITIATLKESFAAAPGNSGGVDNPDDGEGISLWIDTSSLTDDGALVGDDFGGGNEIPAGDIPDPGGEFIPPLREIGAFLGFEYDSDLDDNGRIDFYEVKRAHFDLIRTRIFRYAILGKWRNEDGNKYPGGQAEIGGDDLIAFGTDPAIFMHEFGHNLALDHGGGPDPMNCKPNYVSVMSYTLPFGIPRRSTDEQAQDFDRDGDLDPFVLDYSPPRFPGGRGFAPIFSSDEGLDEDSLDERRPLDSADQANKTRFFNPDGEGRSLQMDADPDWNDDGVNNAPDDTVEVDVNGSDEVLGCGIAPQVGISELAGHDDWSVVELPIVLNGIVQELVQNDNGATPVPEMPDPDPETREAIEGVFSTVDLSVTKTADADLVMAGQVLTYEIEVENAGPSSALHVVVEDTLPAHVALDDLPDQCTLAEEDGLLACDMDVIEPGESRTLTLPVRVAPRLPCGTADTVSLENLVSVRNGDFPDLNPRDNSASLTTEALCLRYEYAAKFVCGAREEAGSLLAAPGRYSTIVNIHNFQSRTVPFFKKLALAFPPEEQTAGDIHPIGIDELGPDEALKADCDDIRRNVFAGDLPGGFIDGYLVVQSPRKLDVDAFYSAASTAGGPPGSVSTIDVEEVVERDLRADLSIEKTSEVFPIPLGSADFLSQFRLFAVLYTIRIENGGAVHAENIEVADTVSLALAGSAAAAMVVPDTPFEIPAGAERSPIEHDPFPPAARFSVTLPEIAPEDTVEIRFWTLALIYLSNPDDPANRADLVNRVETSGQGPEVTLIDNEAETLDTLVE